MLTPFFLTVFYKQLLLMKDFNLLKMKFSFLIFFILWAIGMNAQTHASYPLFDSFEDVTGNFGSMSYIGTPIPGPPSAGNPACVAGNFFLDRNRSQLYHRRSRYIL